MLQVVMCLEQSVSSEKFDEDATDREHVAGEAPAQACSSQIRAQR